MQKGSSKAQNYKYAQIFGYKGPGEKILEEDLISVVKYDRTGNYLALGDNAGRVIVFQADPKKDNALEYFAEFQSHSKEFDHLRSMDIEEGIVGLDWLSPQGRYLKLVSANGKHIKLWRLYEKVEKRAVKAAGKELALPKLQNVESYYSAKNTFTFGAKHLSAVNAISSSKNEEYLLSSDEAQLFLWNYEKGERPYIVGDLLGGGKLEEIEQTINFSKMHPTADSLFIYGTNKGNLRLCDLRVSSSEQGAANFKNQFAGQRNFLTDYLVSYSSADFGRQGRYIVTKDYLSVKVWDVCNAKKPISAVCLNEGMKGKLSEVFENEAIFDKFRVACSPDGNTVAAGSYSNCFHLVDQDGTNVQYELSYKKSTVSKNMVGKGAPLGKVEYVKKTTALDFHPWKNTVAVASLNCFFLYGM